MPEEGFDMPHPELGRAHSRIEQPSTMRDTLHVREYGGKGVGGMPREEVREKLHKEGKVEVTVKGGEVNGLARGLVEEGMTRLKAPGLSVERFETEREGGQVRHRGSMKMDVAGAEVEVGVELGIGQEGERVVVQDLHLEDKTPNHALENKMQGTNQRFIDVMQARLAEQLARPEELLESHFARTVDPGVQDVHLRGERQGIRMEIRGQEDTTAQPEAGNDLSVIHLGPPAEPTRFTPPPENTEPPRTQDPDIHTANAGGGGRGGRRDGNSGRGGDGSNGPDRDPRPRRDDGELRGAGLTWQDANDRIRNYAGITSPTERVLPRDLQRGIAGRNEMVRATMRAGHLNQGMEDRVYQLLDSVADRYENPAGHEGAFSETFTRELNALRDEALQNVPAQYAPVVREWYAGMNRRVNAALFMEKSRRKHGDVQGSNRGKVEREAFWLSFDIPQDEDNPSREAIYHQRLQRLTTAVAGWDERNGVAAGRQRGEQGAAAQGEARTNGETVEDLANRQQRESREYEVTREQQIRGDKGDEYVQMLYERARRSRVSFYKLEYSGKKAYFDGGAPDRGHDFYLGLSDEEADRLEARIYLQAARARVQACTTAEAVTGNKELQGMTKETWKNITNTPGVSETLSLYMTLIARPDLGIHRQMGLPQYGLLFMKDEAEVNAYRERMINYVAERFHMDRTQALTAEAMAYNIVRVSRIIEEKMSVYDPEYGPIVRSTPAEKEQPGAFRAPAGWPEDRKGFTNLDMVASYGNQMVLNPASMMVLSLYGKDSGAKPWPTNDLGTWFKNQYHNIGVDGFNVMQRTPLAYNMFSELKFSHGGQKYSLMARNANGSYEGGFIDIAQQIVDGSRDSYQIPWDDFSGEKPFFGWDFFNLKGASVVAQVMEASGTYKDVKAPDITKAFLNAKTVTRQTREMLYILIRTDGKITINPKKNHLSLTGSAPYNQGARERFVSYNPDFFTDGLPEEGSGTAPVRIPVPGRAGRFNRPEAADLPPTRPNRLRRIQQQFEEEEPDAGTAATDAPLEGEEENGTGTVQDQRPWWRRILG